jgi:hypothetical protein
MRPSKDKFYRVDILELHSVITTIIKEFRVEFTVQDIRNLQGFCVVSPQDYKVADGGFFFASQASV